MLPANADDRWLVTLEAQFNVEHQRWKDAPEGPPQRSSFRKLNQITDRIVGARARGAEGMRIKLRTWIEWYGDGSGFPEDATALIASLAADLDLHEAVSRGVEVQGDCGSQPTTSVSSASVVPLSPKSA